MPAFLEIEQAAVGSSSQPQLLTFGLLQSAVWGS